jgi:hypothetical protein
MESRRPGIAKRILRLHPAEVGRFAVLGSLYGPKKTPSTTSDVHIVNVSTILSAILPEGV